MTLDPKSKAAAGMEALRRRLAAGNQKFDMAVAQEAQMGQFIANLRRGLQEHRQAQNLHQEDVAARLNLTQSAVSKIESGGGDIGLRTIYRYARALGLHPVMKFMPADEVSLTAASEMTAARGMVTTSGYKRETRG